MITETGKELIRDAAEEMQERIEYELRGAWRAGYDYVHIYREHHNLAKSPLSEQVMLSRTKRSALRFAVTYLWRRPSDE